MSKLSGPLLDRIDLHIEVPAVPYKELRDKVDGAGSAEMRQPPVLRKLCTLDEAGERTLEMAVRRLGLSARAHDRILKVARTIADLGESERLLAKHVAEAMQHQSLDRDYWT